MFYNINIIICSLYLYYKNYNQNNLSNLKIIILIKKQKTFSIIIPFKNIHKFDSI
jgi:hypothetical protein